jgi:hypothetical protein
VVVGFDVDFLSFHSSSDSSSNCFLEYYPISWPTLLVRLPSLVRFFVFFSSEKYKQKVSMQVLLLLEKVATETQYVDLATSGICDRNSSMQILLLLENATET